MQNVIYSSPALCRLSISQLPCFSGGWGLGSVDKLWTGSSTGFIAGLGSTVSCDFKANSAKIVSVNGFSEMFGGKFSFKYHFEREHNAIGVEQRLFFELLTLAACSRRTDMHWFFPWHSMAKCLKISGMRCEYYPWNCLFDGVRHKQMRESSLPFFANMPSYKIAI